LCEYYISGGDMKKHLTEVTSLLLPEKRYVHMATLLRSGYKNQNNTIIKKCFLQA